MRKLRKIGTNIGISALLFAQLMSVSGCDLGEEQPLPTPEPPSIETPQPTPSSVIPVPVEIVEPSPTPNIDDYPLDFDEPEAEDLPEEPFLWPIARDKPIIIEGDEEFVRKMEEGLAVLRNFPEYYEMANTYIGQIIHDPDGLTAMSPGMRVPTVFVSDQTLEVSSLWVARMLVHEAHHSELFHEYLNENNEVPPRHVWGEEAHLIIIERERAFLVEAGAPQHYIQHLDNLAENYRRQLQQQESETGN